MIEKAFALKSAIPTLATNGRVAVFPTLDRNVTMLLILKEGFEWENRKKEEVWRCKRCNCYIFPTGKSKVKAGLKYHEICSPLKPVKEITNEMDISRTGVDGPVNMV